MGAETFRVRANGKTAKEAFTAAVEQAHYEYGHRGYTGSIAEKHDFVVLDLDREKTDLTRKMEKDIAGADAETKKWLEADLEKVKAGNVGAIVDALIDSGDSRIDDKWGPAGCFKIAEGQWVFFGWASS